MGIRLTDFCDSRAPVCGVCVEEEGGGHGVCGCVCSRAGVYLVHGATLSARERETLLKSCLLKAPGACLFETGGTKQGMRLSNQVRTGRVCGDG